MGLFLDNLPGFGLPGGNSNPSSTRNALADSEVDYEATQLSIYGKWLAQSMVGKEWSGLIALLTDRTPPPEGFVDPPLSDRFHLNSRSVCTWRAVCNWLDEKSDSKLRYLDNGEPSWRSLGKELAEFLRVIGVVSAAGTVWRML